MIAILFLSACQLCPFGLAPIPVEVDWTMRIDEAPGARLGTIESSAGIGSSWVCACWCDAAWADAWVAPTDDPFNPEPTPYAMPQVDPVTGRDFIARIGVAVAAAASGETQCHWEVPGDVWTVDVEVTP